MADLHGFSRDLVKKHEQELESLIQQGIFKPVFLFQLIFLNILPLVGLVIPRLRATKYIRPSIFIVCLAYAIDALRSRRALLGGNGYMIGLMIAWWLIWTTTLYVFSDIEHDYRRIERVGTAEGQPKDENLDGSPFGTITPGNEGKASSTQAQCTVCASGQGDQSTRNGNPSEPAQYRWQSYPSKFTHRLEWCAGLIFNLRGPEWNWRAPRLGPLPQSVHSQLHSGFISRDLQRENDDSCVKATHCVQKAFRNFVLGYLALDALKVVMMRDPYFRGDTASAEYPFPISCVSHIPLILRFYRSFVSCLGIYTALAFVTALNPIFFLGLSLAFPNASHRLTAAPLDVSWLYADTFGPFFSPVLNDGLAGVWGQWWHQLFRHGFTATARWVLSILPQSWSTDARVKRVVYILIAFLLSGLLHASGSYTQFTETHPLTGPLLFFGMQSIAVILENIFKTLIIPRTPLARSPPWLCCTANAIWVFCWLLFSGPFVADDFAAGGIWLMEPVPLSPLRGLGLASGQGWWCWQGAWFHYWSDGTYWGSGIRMI